MKKLASVVTSIFGLLICASPAFAHVVVKPSQIGVGERTNFAVSVPTEEDTPTVQLRLVIPEGVASVRPNVKQGWRIQLIKSSDESSITEIIWSGGSIPADQRDEFVFSAQAPAQEGTLVWKAYQAYGDGTVVAWEVDPQVVEEYSNGNSHEGEDDHNAPRPYSQTMVVNDLIDVQNRTSENATFSTQNTRSITYSLVAVALSVCALAMQFYNRKK